MFLKRYVAALFKKQWGTNLSKFNGVAMMGGVTLNGAELYNQALQDIERLEEDIKKQFETPVDYMIG